MHVSINLKQAEKIIIEAYNSKCKLRADGLVNLHRILSGSHKTYKYVLVTALLAKAANAQANPLALQAGANLEGAYDARSLCHKVLVPFERNFLNNALGGSNEPFLNKPARFTHLSADNAVRKGDDQETLLLLIELLNGIRSSADAKNHLACVFSHLREVSEKNRSSQHIIVSQSTSLSEIARFSRDFSTKSIEGETLAIIIGTLEKMYYRKLGKGYKVVTHKVNQSGASSREIGDIDVFCKEEHYFSIEAKNKDFTIHDVNHAFQKAFSSGASKAMFVYGTKANFDAADLANLIQSYEERGYLVLIQSFESYLLNALFRISSCSIAEFHESLSNTLLEVNSKQETAQWLNDLSQRYTWVKVE